MGITAGAPLRVRACKLGKKVVVYTSVLGGATDDRYVEQDVVSRCEGLRALSATKFAELGDLRPTDLQDWCFTAREFLASTARCFLRHSAAQSKALELAAVSCLSDAAFGAASAAVPLLRPPGSHFADVAAAGKVLVRLAESCLDLIKALLHACPAKTADAVARSGLVACLVARLAGSDVTGSSTPPDSCAAGSAGSEAASNKGFNPCALGRVWCGEYLLALVSLSSESAALSAQLSDAFWACVAGPLCSGAGWRRGMFVRQHDFFLVLRLLTRIVESEKAETLAARLPDLLCFVSALDLRGTRCSRQALEFVLLDVLLSRLASCPLCRAALKGEECKSLLAELAQRAAARACAHGSGACGLETSVAGGGCGSYGGWDGPSSMLLWDALPGLASPSLLMDESSLFEVGWWS